MNAEERIAKVNYYLVHAIDNAIKKHGELTDSVVRMSAILTEECGEVARAALGVTRPRPTATYAGLRYELAQVAATAILALNNYLPGEAEAELERQNGESPALENVNEWVKHHSAHGTVTVKSPPGGRDTRTCSCGETRVD